VDEQVANLALGHSRASAVFPVSIQALSDMSRFGVIPKRAKMARPRSTKR
jgi:hypothetical protein